MGVGLAADSALKRVALGLAWLAASYLGTALIAWTEVRAELPWYLGDVIYFAPLAALLAVIVRDRIWSFVVVAGLAVLAVVEHVALPPVGMLVRPLLPAASIPPAPRIDYLAGDVAFYVCTGLVIGVVELAVLWPYLKPAWMWVVFKVIAGPFTALAVLWQTYLPVPGAPRARWDWLAACIGAIAIGVLWRWNAEAPRVRWPGWMEDPEVDPAYAAWVADLEGSLEKPA